MQTVCPRLCRFDIDATITELKGVVGQPTPPHPMAKDSVEGNVFGKGVLTFSSDKKKKDKSFVEGGLDGRSLAKRKIFNDGENESKGGDEGKCVCVCVCVCVHALAIIALMIYVCYYA